MISNFWYDRTLRRRVEPDRGSRDAARELRQGDRRSEQCQAAGAADARRRNGRAERGRAEDIRERLAEKRTAITLAGHRSDATVWYNDKAQAFVTSSAYTASPLPFLETFFKTHPIAADEGKAWTLKLKADTYQHADAGAGELPPKGWTPLFPHQLGDASDAEFVEHWKTSPYADAYLGAIAQSAVTALKLGKGNGTDYLAVSFSTLDNVGHKFGPRSHEVQDVLLRLDDTIGDLLRFLDTAVGEGRDVVALSADHGVMPIPDQLTAEGVAAGRVKLDDIRQRLEAALAPLGAGPHVARVEYADIFFNAGVYDKITADPSLMRAVTAAVLSVPGIDKVFRAEDRLVGADIRIRRSSPRG